MLQRRCASNSLQNKTRVRENRTLARVSLIVVHGLPIIWKSKTSDLNPSKSKIKGKLRILIRKHVKLRSKNGRRKRNLKSSLRNCLSNLLWTITYNISMRRKLSIIRKSMNPNKSIKIGCDIKSNRMCKVLKWILCPNKTNKMKRKRESTRL